MTLLRKDPSLSDSEIIDAVSMLIKDTETTVHSYQNNQVWVLLDPNITHNQVFSASVSHLNQNPSFPNYVNSPSNTFTCFYKIPGSYTFFTYSHPPNNMFPVPPPYIPHPNMYSFPNQFWLICSSPVFHSPPPIVQKVMANPFKCSNVEILFDACLSWSSLSSLKLTPVYK